MDRDELLKLAKEYEGCFDMVCNCYYGLQKVQTGKKIELFHNLEICFLVWHNTHILWVHWVAYVIMAL